MNDDWLVEKVLFKGSVISDAPTGRFCRTARSVSDNQWVGLVLAKNYRTPNSSVVLFFKHLSHFLKHICDLCEWASWYSFDQCMQLYKLIKGVSWILTLNIKTVIDFFSVFNKCKISFDFKVGFGSVLVWFRFCSFLNNRLKWFVRVVSAMLKVGVSLPVIDEEELFYYIF